MNDRKDGSVGEEVSAFGERATGAAKAAYGSVTGDSATKREGERENAEGNLRQENNGVIGGSSSSTGRRSGMVTGMFRDRESAEKAYSSVSSRGYGKDDVNLLMSDETRKTHFASSDTVTTELGDKAMEGAGIGSAIGGTAGAILAGIAAIGTTLALPGLGLIIAGPIAAALAGAGAGGLTGGLVGALVGSGIPEDRAKEYETGVKNGGIVMGVNPRSDDDAEYFEREFKNNRGESVYR